MDITKTIRIPKGRYIVAVSGGVDSIVLLDMLRQLPGLHLTVAHFDHGIREDSRADRLLVQEFAGKHGLPFVYAEGNLGPGVSEDTARKARYEFLHKVKNETKAHAIITAHHQDDVLETTVHNILRGTGRKGMGSLRSVDGILRPITHLPKKSLVAYALANNIQWREDSTNKDTTYRRNYIRHKIMPKIKAASPRQYETLKHLVRRQRDLNHAIDNQLSTMLHVQPAPDTLRRLDVTMLPHQVGRELVAHWLRLNGKGEMNHKMVDRLTIALKTARPHSAFVLDGNRQVHFDTKHARMIKVKQG